jgi:hypothetical protein
MVSIVGDIEFILTNCENPPIVASQQLAVGIGGCISEDESRLIMNCPIWTFKWSRGYNAPQDDPPL